jgi:hypothetical protein
MHITELISNEHKLAYIREVEDSDFKQITVKRFMFNWKKLKNECKIYKLTLTDSDDILGLIALIDYPQEERTEIKLLTSSAENIGKKKLYDRIPGCLIAFAGKEAIKKFKKYPCLSLVPKTELRQHYIKKYKMTDAGWQLYLEDIPLFHIINEYLS